MFTTPAGAGSAAKADRVTTATMRVRVRAISRDLRMVHFSFFFLSFFVVWVWGSRIARDRGEAPRATRHSQPHAVGPPRSRRPHERGQFFFARGLRGLAISVVSVVLPSTVT